MDEFSLTGSQRRTAKKTEKKRRKQAKGTPADRRRAPTPRGGAPVPREQFESSGDDEDKEADETEAENDQPGVPTLAEDVIESLNFHAPDTPPVHPEFDVATPDASEGSTGGVSGSRKFRDSITSSARVHA